MLTDNPNASWHPAFMPNSPDAPTRDVSSGARAVDPLPSEPIENDYTTNPDPTALSHEIANVGEKDAGKNAWFAEESADDWPVFERPGMEDISNQETSAAEAAPVNPEEKAEPPPPATSMGHASSVSFARTVSQEVNWIDDEDTEWNLSRTGTDPFKSMPPNDRTNSFPAVPPLTETATIADEHPLPSIQAEDVMNEIDNEYVHDDIHADNAGAFVGPGEQLERDDSAQLQYTTEDISETEAPALGARYEEGVPLIPHPQHEDSSATNSYSFLETNDSFAHENTEDEDPFFTQIQESGADDFLGSAGYRSLERKSTMQVLGSLNNASLSREDTLEETPEEVEDTASKIVPAMDQATSASPSASTEALLASGEPKPAETAEDLAAKWQAAFAGDEDEDFLLEDSAGNSKAVDPAAFFGSDDEGFLEDDEETPAPQQPVPGAAPTSLVASAQSPGLQNRYAPQNSALPSPNQPMPSPYLPQAHGAPAQVYTPSNAQTPFLPTGAFGTQQFQPPIAQFVHGPPKPRPEPAKAQSFADKAKGGYTSPYDLPMEVVKPRKRASMQQLPRSTPSSAPEPPPRSTSVQVPLPPTIHDPSSGFFSPPASSHSGQPPLAGRKPAIPALRSKESFFEDLPIVPKHRPGSRQSSHLTSPTKNGPAGPAGLPQTPIAPMAPPVGPQIGHAMAPPQGAPSMTRQGSGGLPNLVAPERVSPYAPLQSQNQPPPSAQVSTRYSPAPGQSPIANGIVRPTSSNRYSPAPPVSRAPATSYNSVPVSATPPSLPHQPRTSSPLAHFEVTNDRSQSAPTTNGDHSQHDRRSVSNYEPRLNRVSSLPPTREVEEEEEFTAAAPSHGGNASYTTAPAPVESRYSPVPPVGARQTPPPPAAPPAHSTFSPTKRATSNYAPQPHPSILSKPHDFAPPQRSQTQSPGSLHGGRNGSRSSEPLPRPSSVHGPTSPRAARSVQQPQVSSTRARGPSQSFNMVAPTDGREQDPLQRWKGVPILSWGVGGTIVTTFPKNVPRYGMNQTMPMMLRSPGEVRIQNIKDIQPLEERLARFPGPLKGKSKKKETIAWMSTGIETLERELPNTSFQTQVSLEDKRTVERVLLWKILRVFIEFDGTLEGNPAVEKAVRDVLAPGQESDTVDAIPLYGGGASANALQESASTRMMSDSVDASAIDQIRRHLLVGDREKAVWAAVDKRLWGHAMLISNTVSPDLYKQVAQEFVRKEVNYPGHNNESLAALYKILSGNHEDCVDELVPVHARAGLQLMNTSSPMGTAPDVMEGLDKWRETLGLVLSNRSPDDIRALNALGNLLSGYGRAEAAHICFLFARKATVFGGLDDPNSNFVLVGSDHHSQAEQFAKETEAVLLSEVYEYGLSLSSGALSTGAPHLAAYKLQHAMTLAEYGYRDKALQYCEAISNSIIAQTKRSPYHHAILESAVEDLMNRLKQAPKEESGSWIPKPSMNKVSDTVWNRFNKFVAGDEHENSGAGSPADGGAETGPFGRIAGGTPTISRSPSVSNFEMYGASNAGYPAGTAPLPVPTTRAASRYAPAGPQSSSPSGQYESNSPYAPAGRSSMELTSNEFSRNSYESTRPTSESQPSYLGGGYTPQSHAIASQSYSPVGHGTTHEPSFGSQPRSDGYSSIPQAQLPAGSTPPGFEPYGSNGTPTNAPVTLQSTVGAGMDAFSNNSQPSPGYQPTPYGYEPPSISSNEVPQTQTTDDSAVGGYEAPSYQPYGYEPPSYNPDPEVSNEDGNSTESKPVKKSFMDDDEDDLNITKTREKSKADKDRENAEMFKKAAEEDAQRAAAAQQGKKGWGFGWFGGAKKEAAEQQQQQLQPNKPVKANLGESSSFVYDPDLKRWVNKKGGTETAQAKTATPPPPKMGTRSNTGTPPPPMSVPTMGRASAPPGGPPRPPFAASSSNLSGPTSQEHLGVSPGPPAMARSVSNTSNGGPPSGPPSRPATSMSNASSIDDLLGAAGPRKPGQKKAKKGGRYVDVMAK